MNKKEYNELKRQAEDEYRKGLALLEKQRMERLAAIETVWNLSNPRRIKPTIEAQEQRIGQTSVTSYGSLANAIKETLAIVPDRFTKSHIRAALKQISPEVEKTAKESSITGRLIRLAKDGLIEQISVGSGSTPSEYCKTSKPNTECKPDDKTNEMPDQMKG